MSSLSTNDERLRRLRLITISVAAWGAIAALFSLQRLFGFAVRGVDPAWDRLVLEMTITWGGWALLTPVIFTVVRRLPIPSETPGRMIWHIPIGIGVSLVHSLIVSAVTPLFIWRPSFLPIRDMFTGRLASAIAFETLIYLMVAGVVYAYIHATEPSRARIPFARIESLAVPSRDGLTKVPVASIDWMQAEDNYVRLYAAGRSHLVRTTLTALEQKLAATNFIRIHRSAMVSVARIARLKRLAADRYAVVLADGTQLRVSRAYRKRVVEVMETPLAP